MQFIPYGKQSIYDEDRAEVTKVLEGGWITTGPKVKEFEQEVANYCGAKHGIAVNSGTSALDIAVQALELPPGSEIITTPLTFIATINSILFNNHKAILADIKKDTYNIDPEDVKRKITPYTKAIIYVDYAGQPCEIEELQKIAKEHNLFLIQDSAQSLGAKYKGETIGRHADMTTLSFHPVKHITTGEGGMVLTNNDELDQKLRILRNHGMNKDVHERFGPNAGWFYDIKHLARNYRVTDFQCALGLSQLGKLEEFIAKRQQIAQRYKQQLGGIPGLILPHEDPNIHHAWHLFPVLIKGMDRDEFFKLMRENNIGVNVHHIPPYEFTYHKRFGWKAEDYPVADSVFRSTITLPIHPALTHEEQTHVIETVKKIIQNV